MSETWIEGTDEAGSGDDPNDPIEPAGRDDLEGDVELGFGEGATPDSEQDIER